MNTIKTILLIDDEVDLQELVKIALKSKGYEVITAGNGVEGLEVLTKKAPDLIILDMNMPKMGGLEFYQKICDDMNRPKYPVLVLTARANMEQLFREFNIDGFMAKPFEIPELLQEVATILRHHDGASQAVPVMKKEGMPKICIAENNSDSFNQISSAFLNAGYIVHPARNGTEAIERINKDLPDVALIKLDLHDISGDIVVGKLKRMPKTHQVTFIVYTQHSGDKLEITDKISHKEGVDAFIVYTDAASLCNQVSEILNNR